MLGRRLLTTGGVSVQLATVTTASATSISATSMTLNASISDLGGGSVSSYGFYFGTSSTYSNNTKINLGSTSSTLVYNNTRTGLSNLTTYYITAFAINEAGESVGSTVSATTTWAATLASMKIQTNTTFTGYSYIEIGVYHDTAYSGSITTNNTFSYSSANAGAQYTVNAATNANNMAYSYINTSTNASYNKSTTLYLIRLSSRTFSNVVNYVRYNPGGAYVSASSTSSTNPYCTVYHPQSAGFVNFSSAAINFRYS